MPLGKVVGLGPGHIVLDGDHLPHSSPSPILGPCLLWPNGRPSQQLLSCCQNSFIDRLSCELAEIDNSMSHPSRSLPCEMFVRKKSSCSGIELANCHAGLSHSKPLLNILPLMLASFGALTKRYLQWPHQNTTE